MVEPRFGLEFGYFVVSAHSSSSDPIIALEILMAVIHAHHAPSKKAGD